MAFPSNFLLNTLCLKPIVKANVCVQVLKFIFARRWSRIWYPKIFLRGLNGFYWETLRRSISKHKFLENFGQFCALGKVCTLGFSTGRKFNSVRQYSAVRQFSAKRQITAVRVSCTVRVTCSVRDLFSACVSWRYLCLVKVRVSCEATCVLWRYVWLVQCGDGGDGLALIDLLFFHFILLASFYPVFSRKSLRKCF